MITYLMGDATDPWIRGNKVIAHVCNDQGGWGRGFVKSLSEKWSLPETQYRRWYEETHNMPGMEDAPFVLGNVQFVPVEHKLNPETRVETRTIVANMLAQNGYTTDAVPAIRYDALHQCLKLVVELALTLDASIHMPRIGCGLAGGKWDDIEPIINDVMSGVEVYVYDLGH